MKTFISAANVVLGIVNLVLFALWLSMIRIDALPKGAAPAEYMLNQLSVGVAILGIIVTVAALILAALGVFGFQSIRDSAMTKADQTAKATVRAYLNNIRTNAAAAPATSAAGPLPPVENPRPEEGDV